MNKAFRFTRSAYWGDGHWLVAFPEGNGRVSRAEDGTWSAFDWVTPIKGTPTRPALAEGLSTRKDAAIVLRATQQVADAMMKETEELIKTYENRSCGHV